MDASTPHQRLLRVAKRLANQTSAMTFRSPVTHVYNPLQYAWKLHAAYIKRCPAAGCHALYLGMNPGPYGMAQTGVPFGEVAIVRDWLALTADVDQPAQPHPKRPVEGLACRRSEVSGRRLWGLFRDRFGTADRFFEDQFVVNYCPLVFMEASGRNRTPDKLAADERETLARTCDEHLAAVLETLRPTFTVAVGGFAEACLQRVVASRPGLTASPPRIVRVLHPSPASPAANRDWAGTVTTQLTQAGVW